MLLRFLGLINLIVILFGPVSIQWRESNVADFVNNNNNNKNFDVDLWAFIG